MEVAARVMPSSLHGSTRAHERAMPVNRRGFMANRLIIDEQLPARSNIVIKVDESTIRSHGFNHESLAGRGKLSHQSFYFSIWIWSESGRGLTLLANLQFASIMCGKEWGCKMLL